MKKIKKIRKKRFARLTFKIIGPVRWQTANGKLIQISQIGRQQFLQRIIIMNVVVIIIIGNKTMLCTIDTGNIMMAAMASPIHIIIIIVVIVMQVMVVLAIIV